MFRALIDKIDDCLNPIVVKELRQSTNSSMIMVVMLLFLAIQLFIMFVELFFNDGVSFDHTSYLFPWFLSILYWICLILVIPASGWRFSKERNSDTQDLIYATILTPFGIINGKTFSNVVMIVFIYSLCAPFIVISYLLPGTDLMTIIIALIYSFILTLVMSQFMIMISSSQGSKISQGGVFGLYFLACFFSGIFSSAFFFEGFSSSRGEWWVHLAFIYCMILMIGLFYMGAVSIISPVNSNRSLGLRTYIAACWLMSLLIAVILSFSTNNWFDGYVHVWMVISIILMIIFASVAACKKLEYSARVRRQIPQSKMLRVLCYPFFSGAFNGVFFSILFILMTAAVTLLVTEMKHEAHLNEILIRFICASGYFVWFSLMALKIRTIFKRFPNLNGFLIILFIVIITTLFPILLGMVINPGRNFSEEKIAPFMIFSFSTAFFEETRVIGIFVGWGLALLFLVLNASGIFKSIRDFAPLKPEGQTTLGEMKDSIDG